MGSRPAKRERILAASRFYRLRAREVYFEQLFARWYPGRNLLRCCIDHRAAVRIRVSPINTEGDPARMRLLLGILEERDTRDLFGATFTEREDVDVSEGAVR